MKSRTFSLKEYSGLATAFLFINANTNAQVIYTDIDPDIELNLDGQSAGVDMDNNGTIDFAFLKVSFSFTTFWGSSDITVYVQGILAGPYGISLNAIAGTYTQQSEAGGVYYNPYALNPGNVISGELSFQNNGFQTLAFEARRSNGGLFGAGGNWHPDVENRFLGVKFIDNDDCYHFGWIRCTVADTSNIIIIKDYAYEVTCEHPIVAGDTTSYVGITDGKNNLNLNVYSFGSTVYIKINEKLTNESMHVYNLEGREIYSGELQNQFTEIKLAAPKGIYFVEIISDEGKLTKKLYLD